MRVAKAICSATVSSNPTIVTGTGIGNRSKLTYTVVHTRMACKPCITGVKRYLRTE